MSAFNQDNSRPKKWICMLSSAMGARGQVSGSGDITCLEPTCVLPRPLSLWASAERAEAISPPLGCLRLKRGCQWSPIAPAPPQAPGCSLLLADQSFLL